MQGIYNPKNQILQIYKEIFSLFFFCHLYSSIYLVHSCSTSEKETPSFAEQTYVKNTESKINEKLPLQCNEVNINNKQTK